VGLRHEYPAGTRNQSDLCHCLSSPGVSGAGASTSRPPREFPKQLRFSFVLVSPAGPLGRAGHSHLVSRGSGVSGGRPIPRIFSVSTLATSSRSQRHVGSAPGTRVSDVPFLISGLAADNCLCDKNKGSARLPTDSTHTEWEDRRQPCCTHSSPLRPLGF
jgi:hypothetical protein